MWNNFVTISKSGNGERDKTFKKMQPITERLRAASEKNNLRSASVQSEEQQQEQNWWMLRPTKLHE
jgi:hypothetical protein